jgi:hypothetical protein
MDTQRPSLDLTSPPLYEADFYAWTQLQVKLLKDGTWDSLDIPNLVEELETLGRQERREFVNRLGILIGHLLKWEFQPERRSKSWLATIREQRRQLRLLLEESPSLKTYLLTALGLAFESGVDVVVRETPLQYEDLPQRCGYVLEPTFRRFQTSR